MSEETQENPGEEPSMEDILASIRRILSEDDEEAAGEGEAAAPATAPAAEEPVEDEMAAAMAEMAAAEEPEAPAEDDMAAAMEAMEAEEPAAAEEPEEEMDMAAAMESMEAEEEKPAPAPIQVELAEDEPEPAPPPPVPAPAPVVAAAPPPPPPARPGGEPDISSILDLTREMITSVPEGTEGLVSTATYRASTDVLGDLARAILGQRELQVGGSDITLEGMVREMMRPLLKEWLDQNLPYLIERLVKKEIDLMINRAERLDS